MKEIDSLEAEDRKYRWEISPHPYTTDFDIYVTDDDFEASEALKVLADSTWDCIEDGEEKTISVKRNAV